MTKMSKKIRTYKELRSLRTFEERFDYAKLGGIVGEETFGDKRYLNQILYSSTLWKDTRRDCILRDNGCDLAFRGFDIFGKVYVHHLNPITIDDILERRDEVFDPKYLVCTSFRTHNALHYGDISLLTIKPVERKPYDTCPWKNGG